MLVITLGCIFKAHAAAPTIVPIPNQTVYVDHPALVELLVSDAETPTNLLSLRLSTSNPALIETNRNVIFHWFTDGGSAMPRWYMTVAPTFGVTGTATNTVTVSDGSNSVNASFVLTVVPPPVHAARFANTNQITIPTSGVASQYPSTLNVSGMIGTITNVVITLSHFAHQNPNDLHMLLVSPTGRGMVFWSKVGGGGPSGGTPPDHAVTNVTATVTDDAPDWSPLPPFYYIWTERFRAGDYATGTPLVSAEAPANNFPAPAPSAPYAPAPLTNSTALHDAFAGYEANGTWSLYIYDDAAPYGGKIVSGWSLTVSTTGPLPPTITDIANQTTLTNTPTAALPFTIADADSPIGSLTLSNASSNTLLVPTNNIVFGGSGSNRTVTVTPAAGQSGTATISVFVSDGTNIGSDTFVLNVVTAMPETLSFTNAAVITIRDTNSALPYPSSIAVSGFSGVVTNVTVTLWGFNQSWGSDVDVMLVGPAGQKVMLLSDAGSGNVNNVNLTLSDAAATAVPASNLTGNSTNQPTNLTDTSPLDDNFPAPAPAGPYATALAAFNSTAPNGTWSLYVFDDGPGDIGTFAGGWSMTITTIAGTPPNTAPTITAITNQITTVNTPETGIAFTIGDAQTAASNLVLTALSANTTLVPTNNIVLGGSGAGRTVTITPASNQLGTATITLIVSDGTLSASNSFVQSVNPASLIVTENSASRIYGVTNPALTGSITGLQAGDVITASFTSAAVTNSPVGAYAISFTLSDPGSKLGNYIVTTNNGTLTVTNAPLTVTENSASRSYGVTNPVLTGSITGLRVGDVITASFTSTATTNSPVGAYPIAFILSDPGVRLGNYFLTTNNGTLTVTSVPLTIAENGTNRSYGATNPVLTGSITGLRVGDVITPTFSSTATSNSPVGSYPITFTLTDPGSRLGNYTLTTNNGTLTVVPAALTVTASSTNKLYGGTRLFAGTEFAVTGGTLFNGNTLTNVNLASAGSVSNAPVGSHAINASGAQGLGLTNYSIGYGDGTLTVVVANLLITAADTNKVYGATLNPAEFTATGLANGDSVTNVDLTSAGSGTSAPVGSYSINAANALGAGLTNYSIAYSNGMLTVDSANLLITAADTNKVYGAGLTPVVFAVAGLLNSDSVTNVTLASTGGETNAPVGSHEISASSASGAGLTNYTIGYSNGTLTVGAAGLLITAADTNKIYGATLNPTEFMTTGLLNGDSVTNVSLSSADSGTNATVGNYAISAGGALGAGLTNYSIAYSNGTMTVAQAVLTATADDKSRAYGQSNPVFTLSFTGFVNGETTNALNSLPLASTTATSSTAPGSYPITLAGGTDDNYSFSLVSGSLSISSPGDIAITTVEMVDADHFRLTGTGDADVAYQIQASADLQTWQVLGTATTDGAGAFEFVDASAGGFPARYYRVATP